MTFHLFNIIWIKKVYIDNVIKKVLCVVFYVYIFDFITHLYFLLCKIGDK